MPHTFIFYLLGTILSFVLSLIFMPVHSYQNRTGGQTHHRKKHQNHIPLIYIVIVDF